MPTFGFSLARFLTVGLAILLAVGCGSGSNPAPTGKASTISVPLPTALERHLVTGGSLTAKLTVIYNKNGSVVVKDRPLTVSNGTVSGQIDDLPADADNSYTFTIDYYVLSNGTEIKVASASARQFVAAGPKSSPTSISFSPSSILYMDDDRDGITNLAELEMGTDWNSAASKPPTEIARSSKSYLLSDVMGISPTTGSTTVVGETKSAHYTLN